MTGYQPKMPGRKYILKKQLKLVEVFIGVNMSRQHDGLYAIAKKYGVDLGKLDVGSACVFIARDRCRIKVIAWNGVLSYLRTTDRRRPFSLDALDEFHKAFNVDGSFDYDKALRLNLEKVFTQKKLLDPGQL